MCYIIIYEHVKSRSVKVYNDPYVSLYVCQKEMHLKYNILNGK